MTAIGYPKGRARTNYPDRACRHCGRVMPACCVGRHERAHEDRGGSVSPEEQQTIVRLYNRPRASIRSVARETHWSQTTVLRVLRANGVQMRSPGSAHRKISVEEELKRAQLYGRGLSIADVAEVCGVTYEAVRQTLVRLDVRMRPQGGNDAGVENLRRGRQLRLERLAAAKGDE